MSRELSIVRTCPECGATRKDVLEDTPTITLATEACGPCGAEIEGGVRSRSPEGGLVECLGCGHPELYTQKRFPRAAGLLIVVLAAVLAPFTYYVSLLVAAGLDALLYAMAPDEMHCYVCAARHLGFLQSPRHPSFDRQIPERLKYGDRAVMGKPMREGGTAGAPDPEH